MAKKKTKALWFVFFMVMLGFTLSGVREAEAIPAFARDNKLPCTMCHTGFPKLNAFGMKFKQNGYRMPGQKGSFLWEKPIPLAARIDFLMESSNRNWTLQDPGTDQVPPDMALGAAGEMRTGVKRIELGLKDWQLLAGGTAAPRVSFFFQLVGKVSGLSATNASFPAPEASPNSTDIETAALVGQIDDILPNGLLNLRIGKDHIDPIFLSRPRRLTLASYTIMFQPLTGASLHPNVVGIELNGRHASGLWYALGARNPSPRYNSGNVNESRRLGAYYLFLNYPMMGQTLSLMASTDRIGNANTTNPSMAPMPLAGPPGFPNTEGRTYAAGAALDLYWNGFNLIPAFYYYNEAKAIHGGEDLDVLSGTTELHYSLRPTLIATGRWDFMRVIDEPGFGDRVNQFVTSLAWYFWPNVKFIGEFSYLDAQLRRLTTFPFNNSLYVSVPGQFSNANNARADLTDRKVRLAMEFDF